MLDAVDSDTLIDSVSVIGSYVFWNSQRAKSVFQVKKGELTGTLVCPL